MIPFRLLWADARRLWPGVLVLTLLIAAACALSMAVTLQERAVRVGSARAADAFDLVVGAPGSETQLVLSSVFLQPAALSLLPGRYIEELRNDPLVAWSAPLAFGDSFDGMPIVGTVSAMVTNGGTRSVAAGRVFESEFEAVVGTGTGLDIGDTILPVHGQIGQEGSHAHDDIRYTVVGILPSRGTVWDKAILVPLEAVWHTHGLHAHDHDHGEHAHEGSHSHEDGETHADGIASHERDTPGVPAILVKPESIAGAYQLRARYRSGETLAVFPGEVLTRLYATLGDARSLLSAISGGTQFLLGLSVALVAVVHLHQRRKQIAALRAFGAPRRSIFALIWTGLMLLAVAGTLLGAALGYGAARLISLFLAERGGFHLPVYLAKEDMRTLLIPVLVAAAVVIGPALSVYRQSPARALRD